VLSSEERRIWGDVERYWAEEAEEPPGPYASRHGADLPVAVYAAAGITILLLLFGAAPAGLAVAVTTALGWAAWHRWPRSGGQSGPDASPSRGTDRVAAGEHRPSEGGLNSRRA
jgi:hypothetical protein